MVRTALATLCFCFLHTADAQLKGVAAKSYAMGSNCTGATESETKYYEGCWSGDGKSTKVTVASKEVTLESFDTVGCKDKAKSKNKVKLDECISTSQKYEETSLKGEYYHYEYFGDEKLKEACPASSLEASMLIKFDDMRDGECEEIHKDVFEKRTINGKSLKYERFTDSKCTKAHETYKTIEITADGSCHQIEDLDKDEKVTYSNMKIWYTDKEGRSSKGYNLQASYGVLAVTSVASFATALI